MVKKRLASIVIAAMAVSLLAQPAVAFPRDDQKSAREEMQAGRNMSIRDIERRVIPRMQGYEYLGFEYDGAAQAYRFKFIRDGKVVWVDVDPQTARILRVQR